MTPLPKLLEEVRGDFENGEVVYVGVMFLCVYANCVCVRVCVCDCVGGCVCVCVCDCVCVCLKTPLI